MAFADYDPNEVTLIVGGVPITGYVDGTFLTHEFDEAQFNKVTGADRLTSRAKTNNYAGSFTVNLQQTSRSNDYLAGLWQADRRGGNGVVPVLLKDNSGRTVITAAQAWIEQAPSSSFSKDIEGREWVIQHAEGNWFGGGNQALENG